MSNWDKENRKALRKGKGLYRANCRSCGYLNVVDAGLLVRVINERAGTRRGKIARWSDRQIEQGSRLTGKHAAAEVARANRIHLSSMIQSGVPCSSCGTPIV